MAGPAAGGGARPRARTAPARPRSHPAGRRPRARRARIARPRPGPDRPADGLNLPNGRRGEGGRRPLRRLAGRIIQRPGGDGWERPEPVRGAGTAARPADGPAGPTEAGGPSRMPGMQPAFRVSEIAHSARVAAGFGNILGGIPGRAAQGGSGIGETSGIPAAVPNPAALTPDRFSPLTRLPPKSF